MGKKTEWLLNGATAVIALCALSLVAIRLRSEFRDDPSKPHRISGAAAFASEGHSMGPASAIVTIVEFADYQCPYCRKADLVLIAIREHYPKDVRIVYRHFPLAIHDSALAAARAAECAGLDGDFEPFHHTLFANAKLIGQKDWLWFAREAGVRDVAAFSRCLATHPVFSAIERDRTAGERLGVDGTPTFLVNDLEIPGFLELPELEDHIRDAIDRARRSHS